MTFLSVDRFGGPHGKRAALVILSPGCVDCQMKWNSGCFRIRTRRFLQEVFDDVRIYDRILIPTADAIKITKVLPGSFELN